MPNTLFKDDDFNPKLKDTPWKKRIATELETKKELSALKIEPVAQEQEIHLYDANKKRQDQIHLFLSLKSYGVFAGFYIKKGLILSKDKDQIMTSEWSWHIFLHLLATKPQFRLYFETGYDTQKMGFRLEGGPKKDFIYRATVIDWGNVLSVLNTWPLNMHCDLYFEKFVDRGKVLELPNDKLIGQWIDVMKLSLPIYTDIVNFES